MPQSIAVVVPAYNEEKTIYQCIKDIRSSFPLETSIFVADNCSTDATARIALKCGADVQAVADQGKGFAVYRGLLSALGTPADWFVLHDADGEYCAKDVAALLEATRSAGVDTPVMGVGLRQVALGHVLLRSVFANWFTKKLLQFRTKKEAPADILTGSRVFNRKAVYALLGGDLPILGGFELETGITKRALEQDVKILTAEVRYMPRSCGEKKISAWDLFPIAKIALA